MILELVRQSGLHLQRRGDTFVSLCPFHNDKDTPSFVIYPHTESWYCFGACQSGGDSIDYVMRFYNVGFIEAKEKVSNYDYSQIKLSSPKEVKTKIVPHQFITYWHSMLSEQHREYFYNRGFSNQTIEQELFGFDGTRLCIPVWDWEPQYSNCLGVRKRKIDNGEGPKYVGLRHMNGACVYGKYSCLGRKTVLAFAGELDARLAIQDGFGAFSLVNGVGSFTRFPDHWQHDWFPDTSELIVIFDVKEESAAGKFAGEWNKVKGFMKARIFHWKPSLNVKDYNEFRLHHTVNDFKHLLEKQGFLNENYRV